MRLTYRLLFMFLEANQNLIYMIRLKAEYEILLFRPMKMIFEEDASGAPRRYLTL